MSVTKHVLCLANSKKMSGRCVAGREVLSSGPGSWIRPVSDRPTEEVSENERQYEDGSDPRVLDIISIPLIRHHPHACQVENWVLDPHWYWERVRQVGWSELQTYVENPFTLWTNNRSTTNGENDEILRAEADQLPCSLYLIHVMELELRVYAPGAVYGNAKRRVQARFQYGGARYWLWVTDPVIEREFLALSNGSYTLGESCVCVSLGEPFKKNDEEFRYKLVAAIIRRALVQP